MKEIEKRHDYNIPSNNRELQQYFSSTSSSRYYNIPSNNRELQRNVRRYIRKPYYNIPSNNRELQHSFPSLVLASIITYQVITGNYSVRRNCFHMIHIITYQVITGNYNYNVLWESSDNIFKKI